MRASVVEEGADHVEWLSADPWRILFISNRKDCLSAGTDSAIMISAVRDGNYGLAEVVPGGTRFRIALVVRCDKQRAGTPKGSTDGVPAVHWSHPARYNNLTAAWPQKVVRTIVV